MIKDGAIYGPPIFWTEKQTFENCGVDSKKLYQSVSNADKINQVCVKFSLETRNNLLRTQRMECNYSRAFTKYRN